MHELQSKLLALFRARPDTPVNLRQLGLRLGGQHPQNIKYHLQRLVQKGLMQWRDDGTVVPVSARRSGAAVGRRRAASQLIAIPIVGAACCGPARAIAEEQIVGYLQVSPTLVNRRRDLFAIRAVGDSMNRADIGGHTIDDGDFVLIDPQRRNPKDGDFILFVADGLANIKRFRRDAKRQQLLLLSESSREYPPIYFHPADFSRALVNGTVLRVMKRPGEEER